MKARYAARVPQLAEREAAWLAGVIDTDGCVSASRRTGRSRGQATIKVSQAITEVGCEVISALLRITHVGGIYYRQPSIAFDNAKPQLTWDIGAFEDCVSIAKQCPDSVKLQGILPTWRALYE